MKGHYNFIPEIISEKDGEIHATFLLHLARCPSCRVPMMPNFSDHAPFRNWYVPTIKDQMERAGWRWRSRVQNSEGHYYCADCAQSGTDLIRCVCCQMTRPASLVQESFGDPPEYLCKVCYDTAPAKVWEQLVDQLTESHQYDWG